MADNEEGGEVGRVVEGGTGKELDRRDGVDVEEGPGPAAAVCENALIGAITDAGKRERDRP